MKVLDRLEIVFDEMLKKVSPISRDTATRTLHKARCQILYKELWNGQIVEDIENA